MQVGTSRPALRQGQRCPSQRSTRQQRTPAPSGKGLCPAAFFGMAVGFSRHLGADSRPPIWLMQKRLFRLRHELNPGPSGWVQSHF